MSLDRFHSDFDRIFGEDHTTAGLIFFKAYDISDAEAQIDVEGGTSLRAASKRPALEVRNPGHEEAETTEMEND